MGGEVAVELAGAGAGEGAGGSGGRGRVVFGGGGVDGGVRGHVVAREIGVRITGGDGQAGDGGAIAGSLGGSWGMRPGVAMGGRGNWSGGGSVDRLSSVRALTGRESNNAY